MPEPAFEPISHSYPEEPIDGLLRRSAQRSPHRTAIRTERGEITFAELDAQASRLACALTELLDEPGSAVGVPVVLDPSFAIVFNAVSRSNNVIVTINPLLRESALEHMFVTAGVSAAFVTTALYQRIEPMRHRLPRLRALIVLDGPAPDGTSALADLLDGQARVVPPLPQATTSVACIQFTSGTTGMPKAVLLSHRNLVVNAVQVAEAHELTGDSVTFNHLPAYHLMHLNSAIYAGACQVLCRDPDPVASIDAAVANRAGNYYGLPVRLARLAADPRLSGLHAGSLRGIHSGGSALSVDVASVLSAQFGIPVIQGYGLAEAAPLTHCDRLDAPTPGSVGPPVRDTECRIVHIETRDPLPAGAKGEVQVRGPQVMLGYLQPDEPSPIDADGWLSTGDVGYQDANGRLFLVDRIKDVFKCDNELVSPAEIERVLAAHPAVRDCVVVDYPHRFSGAVAYAFVVPHDPAAADLAEITNFVNAKVPYYQCIHHMELAEVIPRSPIGKIQRRVLRDRLLARGRTE
ncbi:class I adenylate-forming enzyme family protein [Nocardia arthritidis]|uniref:AMP-binding protein n=1 Tax=Nocardia arthritidis TaxID=228602 RepID=A0A6G9YAG2_9NOCA|nr:class I adenylate-forming enzyme family protein [Nocardia arthritidis]QIS10033.1 AMP-binding protein [Nocardia arthritidis]